MAFFKQIHKERKAKNIGLSIKESVLTLKKQLEERNEAPLMHPFTGTPLTKDEIAYIQRIQGEKGFQTVREAFAYFEGRLEGRIEKRLGAKALEQTLGEASKEAPITETPLTIDAKSIDPALTGGKQCRHYSFNRKRKLVECAKDYITKNHMVHSITQEVCDQCWDRIQSKKQAQENLSENHATTVNIETP
jgi:hypothetical protein